MLRILFVGGGSIGHIAPCVAVWRAVKKQMPDAEAHFVCSTREGDSAFLTSEKLPFTVLGPRNVTVLNVIPLLIRSWTLLQTWKPHAVFAKGGGVTIPVVLAAWLQRIPVVVHESDAVPGRATAFLSRFAAETVNGFPGDNPIRPEVTRGSREEGVKITGFSGTRPVLLVLGGSQGAQAINEAIAQLAPQLLRSMDIAHITGPGKSVASIAHPGYWHREFVQTELPHLYAIASLAISRAGAGSISELAAVGIPAILVPLRGIAHDHQAKNAAAAASSGGCIILEQQEMPLRLVPLIEEITADRDRLQSMSRAIRVLHNPEAGDRVAHILTRAALAKRL